MASLQEIQAEIARRKGQPSLAAVQAEIQRRKSQRGTDPSMGLTWPQVGQGAMRNFLPSAGRALGGIWDAVTNPVDTTRAISNVAGGTFAKLLEAGGQPNIPAGIMQMEPYADAVAEGVKDRYGGMEATKRTLATDPVGALIDASAVLGPAAVARNVSRGPKMVERKVSDKEFTQDAPTTDDLRTRGSRLYDEAAKLDEVVAPEQMTTLATKLDEATKGYDALQHPKMERALTVIKSKIDEGKPVSMEEINTMRQQLGFAMEDINNRSQTMFAKKAQSALDKFVEGLGSEAGAKYGQARATWARLRKTEVLDEAIKKGERAASGAENGIRQEFRAILNNKKKRKQFNAEELKAIEDVAQGKFGRNVLRFLGKFGLDKNHALLGYAGIGGGAAAGGPLGAIFAPLVGTASQRAATKSTANAADLARAMAAKGAVPGTQEMGRRPSLLPATVPLGLQATGLNPEQFAPLLPSPHPLLPAAN